MAGVEKNEQVQVKKQDIELKDVYDDLYEAFSDLLKYIVQEARKEVDDIDKFVYPGYTNCAVGKESWDRLINEAGFGLGATIWDGCETKFNDFEHAVESTIDQVTAVIDSVYGIDFDDYEVEIDAGVSLDGCECEEELYVYVYLSFTHKKDSDRYINACLVARFLNSC